MKVLFKLSISIFLALASISQDGFCAEKDFLQLRSSHFFINYENGVSKEYVSKVKNAAEKFYKSITQEFRFIRDELWLWENRAQIFIAKDKDSYNEKFKCQSWSEACVDYQQKLIYTYANQSRFTGIFAHELTHIIFREYVGGGAFSLWLDEGIAIYMEDKYGGRSYKSSIFALRSRIKDDSYIKFSELSKVNPHGLSSSNDDYVDLFYLESFSIVDFIISKYGKYKFANFLSWLRKGYGLEQSLGKAFYDLQTLDKLEEKWKEFYRR